jgi:hypothetical protein
MATLMAGSGLCIDLLHSVLGLKDVLKPKFNRFKSIFKYD